MLNTVHALSSLISSPLLPDGAPLPGPQSGLLSNTWKWSVSGDTCWLSERLYWDGMARQTAAGSGDPGELLCHVFTASGFRIMGFISRLSLAHHLPVPIFGMTVVLPVGTHISQPRWILSWGPLGGWQDVLWACTSSLLLAPPKFCQLVFSSSTMFLMGTSCCETTCEDASGHYCTWTKQVVSVNASVTPLTIFVLWKWNLSFKQAN